MKAYELTATVTDNGQIQLPDFRLASTSSQPSTVKVIILVDEIEENQNELDTSDDFKKRRDHYLKNIVTFKLIYSQF